jgi:hypothetical protein
MKGKRLVFWPALFFLAFLGAGSTSLASTLVVDDDHAQCPTAAFIHIQDAVNSAASGDTIQVCAGTYNELVTIPKTLTILGAQAGVDARTRAVPLTAESIVGSPDGAFQIEADNVVIDGFIIQGVTNDPSSIPSGLGAGIWTNPGFSGTHGGHQIRNNIIENNIIGIELDNDGTLQTNVTQNLIQNNNFSGPDGGTGIDTNFGLVNGVIDSNKVVGHINSGINAVNAGGSNLTYSNNEFDSNRRAIGLGFVTSSSITGNNIHNSTDSMTADIRMFGGVNGLSILCNNLQNGAGRAIRIDDECPGCPNGSILINNNNITGYPVAGLAVDSGGYSGGPGSLDATNNWWGSPTGPTIASNPGGTGEPIVDPDGVVSYKPFLTSTSSCAPFITVVTMGPQAMEGDLKVNPGDTLKVGYDFTMPGKHAAAIVSFKNSKVTFTYTCVSGPGSGTLVVGMSDQAYTVPQNSSDWFPSGDQHSPLVFQGSASVPNVCGGGMISLKKGGTFTTVIASTDHTDKVNIRWHYSANGSAGGWSGTQSVIPH